MFSLMLRTTQSKEKLSLELKRTALARHQFFGTSNTSTLFAFFNRVGRLDVSLGVGLRGCESADLSRRGRIYSDIFSIGEAAAQLLHFRQAGKGADFPSSRAAAPFTIHCSRRVREVSEAMDNRMRGLHPCTPFQPLADWLKTEFCAHCPPPNSDTCYPIFTK